MEFNTNGLSPNDTLRYWSATVLKRMEVERTAPSDKPFQARLRRSLARNGEFWDHYSDLLYVERSRERCARDGGEEIYIGLIVDGCSNLEFGDRRFALRPGDIYIVDFSQPIRAEWLPHRELGLLINRRHAIDILGDRAKMRSGEIFRARSSFTTLFASHLRLLAAEAPRLAQAEQSDVIEVAIQLALLLLRTDPLAPPRLEGAAFMAAARRQISERLSEPDLSPDDLAAALGCSRATLYRHFEREGAGVVETIRDSRLEIRQRIVECRALGFD